MKIIVNIPMTKQIGIDSWKDGFESKEFSTSVTIKEILEWAASVNKEIKLVDLYFGVLHE